MATFDPLAVLAAKRTPIGKFGGSLRSMSAVELGSEVARQTLAEAGLQSEDVGLVVAGLARQAGCGPNPARQIALGSGLPVNVPAYTINQACASGMSAIQAAARHLWLGEAEVVLVVGAESMSNVPYLGTGLRWGQRMGHAPLVDAMYRDGLFCPLCEKIMGETVEALAAEKGISREAQDDWALRSQQLAAAADFSHERITLAQLQHDEHSRPDGSLADLARLKPVFSNDGSLTAGNSSGITDGAAALVMVSPAFLARRQLKPLARYIGGLTVALEPARMGLGPVNAFEAYAQRSGIRDYDWYEINEAFAAQVLACQQELKFPEERLNPHGGAIAIGHPIGCSGARVVVTMLHGLRQRGGGRGWAGLCVSGGLGICAGFEV